MTLTPDEHTALKATLGTDGWKVVEKIIGYCEAQQLEYCGTCKEEHRFNQGILRGIRNLKAEFKARTVPPEPQRGASAYF